MKLLSRVQKKLKKAAPHEKIGLSNRPYLLPLFGLILGGGLVATILFVGKHHSVPQADSHVVYIFDNGKKQTVDTRAQTVGDLVAKLPLDLIPQDVVEPSLKTPIDEDNFRINIYRARPVTVLVDGKKDVTLTGQRSARVIAEQAGLTVYAEDAAVFAPGSVSQGVLGEEVVIKRSKPVYLNLYGTALTVRTFADNVAGLLAEKQIVLGKGDSVKPSLTTRLTAKTQVFVLRSGTKIQTVAEKIAPPTQYINDHTLTFGVTVVRQPGSPGKRLITYVISTLHGKEVKTKIQSAVIEDAVPQIIARGTNIDIPTNKTTIMADAGLSSGDYAYANYIISHESGWCYTKWQGEVGACQAYHGNPGGAFTGYGLCQSTPGNKMANAGSDWAWNPVTQMKWCSNYAHATYGGWAGAYNHWFAYHSW